jgi:hypothetical protein
MNSIFESIQHAHDHVKDHIDSFSYISETKLWSGLTVPCVRMSTYPSDLDAQEMVKLGFRENTPLWTPSNNRNGRDWYLPLV